jgi:hypothetical protein
VPPEGRGKLVLLVVLPDFLIITVGEEERELLSEDCPRRANDCVALNDLCGAVLPRSCEDLYGIWCRWHVERVVRLRRAVVEYFLRRAHSFMHVEREEI